MAKGVGGVWVCVPELLGMQLVGGARPQVLGSAASAHLDDVLQLQVADASRALQHIGND